MMDGIEEYCTYLKTKGYTPGTIRWHSNHLKQFMTYLRRRNLDLIEVSPENVITYLHNLTKRGLAIATRQAHLTAIRGLFSYLIIRKLIRTNPATEIELPKRKLLLPKALTQEEITQLLAVPDLKNPVGLRDRAILELLYSSGLRRQEVSNLNLNDFDMDRGYLRINDSKYFKDRVVPVGEAACKFIEAYLKLVRWWFLKDPKENALFLDSQKGHRLDAKTIYYIVKKTALKSGLTKKISPHTIRHTMATHLLQNKADIRHIQAMLGHASAATTEIYTYLDLGDLKQVYRRAHPRGRRDSDSNS